jgi:hypothetical protein
VPPPPTDRSAQNRRIAAALLELGTDALALAVRAATGHRLRGPAGSRSPAAAPPASEAAAAVAPPPESKAVAAVAPPPESKAVAAVAPPPASEGAAAVAPPPASEAAAAVAPPLPPGEDAAARIDAARERLRSRIAAPAEEDRGPEPPADEQRA